MFLSGGPAPISTVMLLDLEAGKKKLTPTVGFLRSPRVTDTMGACRRADSNGTRGGRNNAVPVGRRSDFLRLAFRAYDLGMSC
jgi:hypothetical protein